MKNFLPLFLVALLGLAGCSKTSDPTPPPNPAVLEARWQGIATRSVVTTPAGGAVSDQTTPFPAGSYEIEVTNAEFIVYASGTVNKRWAYTRTGNTITPTAAASSPPLTIQDLTGHTLTLVSVSASGNNTETRSTNYTR